MNKIRISNERLWEIAQSGEDIDQWIQDNIGLYNWQEHFGITNLPYRSFSFNDEKDATMFTLRWL
jgi:hypothetical protein